MRSKDRWRRKRGFKQKGDRRVGSRCIAPEELEMPFLLPTVLGGGVEEEFNEGEMMFHRFHRSGTRCWPASTRLEATPAQKETLIDQSKKKTEKKLRKSAESMLGFEKLGFGSVVSHNVSNSFPLYTSHFYHITHPCNFLCSYRLGPYFALIVYRSTEYLA
jgi:hypothetical protein